MLTDQFLESCMERFLGMKKDFLNTYQNINQ